MSAHLQRAKASAQILLRRWFEISLLKWGKNLKLGQVVVSSDSDDKPLSQKARGDLDSKVKMQVPKKRPNVILDSDDVCIF